MTVFKPKHFTTLAVYYAKLLVKTAAELAVGLTGAITMPSDNMCLAMRSNQTR